MKHINSLKEQFTLQAEEIDRFSEWLDARLTDANTQRRNRMRLRFLAEELLLRMRDHCGEDAAVEVYFDKTFGRSALRIEMTGAPFNPLNETGDNLGDWNSSLLTAVAIDPKYSYVWGKNVLRIALPGKTVNPLVWIAAAVVLGCLAGVAGRLLAPEAALQATATAVFEPLYDIWIRILNALSGPVIFFMGITTILNTRQIVRQGGTRIYVIGRYFLFSLLAAAFAVLCALPFFWKDVPPGKSGLQMVADAVRLLLPENFLKPFIDSNTPQLLLIAFLAGSAMLILGSRVEKLKKIVQEINMIGLQLAKWVSNLVPVFTCVFLLLEIWQRQTTTLLLMWQPFLLALGVTAVILCAALLLFSLRMKIPPHTLWKKLKKPFLRVLKTGSMDDAFQEAETSCTRAMGIDPYFTKVSLPQGFVLYMPISSVGVLVFTLYAALSYNTVPSVAALVEAVLLAVVLFVATPPVPGANLLAYTVLFSWLGIPGAALIDAMIFDIIFGVAASAANMTMLQLETGTQARRFGLLSLETLRRP